MYNLQSKYIILIQIYFIEFQNRNIFETNKLKKLGHVWSLGSLSLSSYCHF
jgi:hypothetical protein